MSGLENKMNTPELVAIKAAIPTLSQPNRKLARMLIKMIEINIIYDHLNEMMGLLKLVNAAKDENGRRDAVFEFMLPYLSAENQTQLRTMQMFMEMTRIEK